jgi:hypothetical protein
MRNKLDSDRYCLFSLICRIYILKRHEIERGLLGKRKGSSGGGTREAMGE